ncbi:MAG: hypothetical protein C4520_15265 [Candidatus Abyssobacteria bacterium SURF_5]|uniref:Uncharacterized protein n=1 Tax=Abyssobacteria bacterium (strain SURF_5) TaxID=2093360 RepID=A0A3A4NQ84_ABYX5|nr:MAG: hypothetical protein C4520_15265 [Candidatus Abyssubacteria bacterium SURF_5]
MDEHQQNLTTLKRQLRAWERHIGALDIGDRKEFSSWLAQALDAGEFALLVDAEIDRRSLWEIYLNERFGVWSA